MRRLSLPPYIINDLKTQGRAVLFRIINAPEINYLCAGEGFHAHTPQGKQKLHNPYGEKGDIVGTYKDSGVKAVIKNIYPTPINNRFAWRIELEVTPCE